MARDTCPYNTDCQDAPAAAAAVLAATRKQVRWCRGDRSTIWDRMQLPAACAPAPVLARRTAELMLKGVARRDDTLVVAVGRR